VTALLAGAAAWAQPAPGPRNLAAVQATGVGAETRIELRWDPVPGALGYEILLKRNGRWHLNEEDPNYTPITNSTSITGLAPGATFEFAVRAVLPKGLSAASHPVQATTVASSAPAAPVSPAAADRPLPVVDAQPTPPPPRPQAASDPEDAELAGIPLNAPITDLVPPPPQAPARKGEEKPKGPPPPAPEGLLGFFGSDDTVRLSWRPIRDASGYVVEEEKNGQWLAPEEGVIIENRASIVLKRHPSPGPYYFRVYAVRYGLRSTPSLPVRVER
jgi:hypothetical protein